jgi:2'-5' RNA ligase
MPAQVYSIWLMPEEDVYMRLHSLINQLCKPYNTPVFEPHVTLCGRLNEPAPEIIVKTTELARRLTPYKITLYDVDYRNEYYRCLFFTVLPTNDVMSAYDLARKVYGCDTKESYLPHLSIMYGNVKKRIKQSIQKTLGDTFTASFIVKSLHVFLTTGSPKNWHRVARIDL